MAYIFPRVIHLGKTGPDGLVLDCANSVIVYYGPFTCCVHITIIMLHKFADD